MTAKSERESLRMVRITHCRVRMSLMRSRVFATTLALRRRFGVTTDVFNAVRTLAGGKRRRFPPMLPFIRLIHWFAGVARPVVGRALQSDQRKSP